MHRSCRRSRGGRAPGQPSASGGDALGVVAGLVDRRDKRRIVETIAMDRYELRFEVDVDGLDAADRRDLTCHRILAVAAVHAGNRVSLGLHRASFVQEVYPPRVFLKRLRAATVHAVLLDQLTVNRWRPDREPAISAKH